MLPAIHVENLSKQYRLGASRSASYHTLREELGDAFCAPWRGWKQRFRGGIGRARNTRSSGQSHVDNFWALHDVSLDVQPGEVVGIIGRNGAGKSTFLKVLSRITEPTSGRVEIRGRVGSLLEVGTGFHPELTGRENVFLNGAILGMSRQEIARNFDAIVDFAEIESFLDTPVKRYSSGMYVRLAFAVAAHLNPEILILDEVLAVGDAGFQQKCLSKMDAIRRSGRTVLFVSHNLAAVKALCSRAILLEQGRVMTDGPVEEVIDFYFGDALNMAKTGKICEEAPRMTNGEALFRSVKLTDLSGKPLWQLSFGQPFRVIFECDVVTDIPDGHFEVSVSALDGTHVLYSTTFDGGKGPVYLHRGRYVGQADIQSVLLPRQYTIDLGVHHHTGTTCDYIRRTFDFTVLKAAAEGDDHFPWNSARGYVRAPSDWQLRKCDVSNSES